MKGKIVYLYAFDVANEINTKTLTEILRSDASPLEISTDHTFPKDIPLYKPLSVEVSDLKITYQGKEISAKINIYEVGCISIYFNIEFETDNLANLQQYHAPALDDKRKLDEVAISLCKKTIQDIKTSLIQPSEQIFEPEAYTIFCVTNLDKENISTANDWFQGYKKQIAELVTESKPNILSQQQIDETLKINLSYSNQELTIIDWDSAFIVDLTGYVEDTIYVLELANLQLEEYKIMDYRLDNYLNKAYDDVKNKKIGLFNFNYNTLRNLRTLRVDVTKLNDEVTHITKFFGDWYLARVYMGAREKFHLDKWRNSVEERLSQLDALYSVAHSEISSAKMLWLEFIIVVFFAIDLIALFFGGK
ncbi:MAG: hypothetical protein SFT90_02330 [Rickettsiales bacterium]|nr:hypothetical protein [Rickettsiales bacterium]